MEILKKKIKQALTTGTTVNESGETITVIIPDPNAEYSIKFLLNQSVEDLGFFDAYEEPAIPPPTTTTTTTIAPVETYYALDDDGDIFLDDDNDKFEYV